MSDKLDFLNQPETADPAPTPEAQTAPAPEPAPEPLDAGQPRDDLGRFASPNPEPEPAPAPVAPAAPDQPPPGYVPVSALTEERNKRQQYEEQVRRYEEAQAASGVPDPSLDPEGFSEYQRLQVNQAVLNTRLDVSEDLARMKHGDETVDKTIEWAQQKFRQSPAMQQEMLAQRNPYEYAVQAYQRETALAGLTPEDLKAIREWRAAQASAAPPNPLAASAAPTPPPVQPPPQSIAAMPPAGGPTMTPVGAGQAYDGMFKR